MSDLFQMKIRLDGASMTEFGGYVALVCCEFPSMVRSDVLELQALCGMEELPIVSVRAALLHKSREGFIM